MKILMPILLLLMSICLTLDVLGATEGNDEKTAANLAKVTGTEKVILLHKLCLDNLYSNPKQANTYALESLDLAKKTRNDSLIAYSYYHIGLSYYFMDFWSLAVENYLLAKVTKWGKASAKFNARCSNNLGICYEYLGEYKKAAEQYFNSLNTSEKLGDELLAARIQLNIGMLYLRMREYEKSVTTLKLSLKTLVELDDTENIINAYQNLFLAEGELENTSTAISYFKKALAMAAANNDSLKIADIQIDYGNLLNAKGNYSDANEHLKAALDHTDSANAVSYYFIRYSIGKNEMYLGNFEKARLLMTEAFEKLKEYDANAWLTNVQLNLARLYARQNNIALSDKYLEAALEHERKLFDKEKLKGISEMEIKYETEKKEHELAIQKLQIESQSRTILFVVIIALIFATALVFVLLLVKRIKLTNKNLFERNKELTSRWEKLKVCGIDEQGGKEENRIFRSISEVMSKEQLFANPELSVDLISKKIKSNTKYVSRAIKEKTGMNFNTYINTHRIEEAKKILQDPVQRSWSLDAVARQCGFNNPTTFYITFKKYTGLTPATYRNIN